MATNLSLASLKAVGATTSRTLATHITPVINVKDFGALGNNSADDTAAIQAAIDSVGTRGRRIYIPYGIYLITSPINLSTDDHGFIISGDGPGTVMQGNFDGYIFDRLTGNMTHGPRIIERMSIFNNLTSGGSGVRINFSTGIAVQDCYIVVQHFGIACYLNTFTVRIFGNIIGGSGGWPAGSVGMVSCGHCQILCNDFVGLEEGIRMGGSTVNIQTNRLEINKTAIRIGFDEVGNALQAGRCDISGNAFEANDIAFDIVHLAASIIAGNGAQGTSNAPSGQSIYGMKTLNLEGVTFISNEFSDGFTVAGWKSFSAMEDCALIACRAFNNDPGVGVAWDIAGQTHVNTEILACNN